MARMSRLYQVSGVIDRHSSQVQRLAEIESRLSPVAGAEMMPAIPGTSWNSSAYLVFRNSSQKGSLGQRVPFFVSSGFSSSRMSGKNSSLFSSQTSMPSFAASSITRFR
jgi:hypothetical protein